MSIDPPPAGPGGGGAAAPSVPFVYIGSRFNGANSPFNHHPGISRDDAETAGHRVVPQVRPAQDMLDEFDYFSDQKKRSLAKQLFMAGFLSKPDANMMDVQTAYSNLLATAAHRWQGGSPISPQRLLEQNIRYNLAAAGVPTPGKFSDKNVNKWFDKLTAPSASGPKSDLAAAAGQTKDLSGTKVSTAKSVDIYNPMDAKAMLRDTLERELGRAPSDNEMRDFVENLAAESRKNPTITRSTVTTNKQGDVTNSSQVTHGGLGAAGAQEFATEQAQANPGWAEWQAVGTYFPALIQALSSVVPGT